MNRLTANNTTLSYKIGEEIEFTELDLLMEVPELGGAPEKIDVTVLSDKVKAYVPGIKDLGDLVFKFLYDNSSDEANYRVLRKMEKDNTVATFQIVYPDKTAHQFDAIPSVKMDAGTINGALTFSATMMTQGTIKVIDLGVETPED